MIAPLCELAHTLLGSTRANVEREHLRRGLHARNIKYCVGPSCGWLLRRHRVGTELGTALIVGAPEITLARRGVLIWRCSHNVREHDQCWAHRLS
jgi:hypothetical protein